ncbi:MAG: hypothetical protein ABI378_15250 [Chitinophagaceae bacterium]
MHSLRKLILIFPALCLLASCSTDFKVDAPYKPITVVYGLLNMADTAQYIRIQKAFLDETKNSLDMAQVGDSNYYDPKILSVHLQAWDTSGLLVQDYVLNRVDLNDEGDIYIKNSGVFSGPLNAHNYAYKYNRALNYLYHYRLVIRNSATGEVDSAETPVILNQKSPSTYGFTCNQFAIPKLLLAFSEPGTTTPFILETNHPANSGVLEAIIRFHWVDKVGSVETPQSADMHLTLNPNIPNPPTFSPAQIDIQNFLRTSVGPAPSGTVRLLDSSDIFIWAGGEELAKYVTINNATGGLTADQIRPIYTNMKGKNVIGLFSTRTYIARYNVGPTPNSLDTLMLKPSLQSLNFQGVTEH